MSDQTRYPAQARVVHHAPITLADGTILSAMLWLPDAADASPVPAILEYLPYRKRDGSSVQRLFSILPNDPLSATASLHWRKEFARDNWKVSIQADTYMSVSKSHFIIRAILDACEGDNKVFSNQWDCKIPRDHT